MPDAHADGIADAASDAGRGLDDGDSGGTTDARSDGPFGVQVMPDAALADALPQDFFPGIQVMPDSGLDGRSDRPLGIQVMPDAAVADALPKDFFPGIQVMPDSGVDTHPVTADGGSDATEGDVRVMLAGGPQPSPELPRHWLDSARA